MKKLKIFIIFFVAYGIGYILIGNIIIMKKSISDINWFAGVLFVSLAAFTMTVVRRNDDNKKK